MAEEIVIAYLVIGCLVSWRLRPAPSKYVVWMLFPGHCIVIGGWRRAMRTEDMIEEFFAGVVLTPVTMCVLGAMITAYELLREKVGSRNAAPVQYLIVALVVSAAYLMAAWSFPRAWSSLVARTQKALEQPPLSLAEELRALDREFSDRVAVLRSMGLPEDAIRRWERKLSNKRINEIGKRILRRRP